MSAIMDMYFNTTDSLSLQEMLDIDIKAEVDTLIGGHTDFSGFNFADLPPLELDDGIRWFSSNSHHHHHTLSNSSFNLDFSTCGGDDDDEENATTAATMMVNPHVVMPVLSFSSDSFRSPSPSLKESHLAFSPSHMKLVATGGGGGAVVEAAGGGGSKVMIDGGNKLMIDGCGGGNKMLIDGGGGKKLKVVPPVVTAVKKDLMSTLNGVRVTERKSLSAVVAPPPVTKFTKVTPILTKSIVKAVTKQQQQQHQQPTLLSFRNTVQRHQLNSPITVSQVSNITSIRNLSNSTLNSNPRKHFTQTTTTTHHPSSLNSTNTTPNTDHRIFPKPAYSYSCLIAMALKNSRSGSLPVSEIYSFMCAHFPYFKTAPNGWKNSVRHNLSLNKCFEKIEKPALNGAQRKGCLWAMNPDKVVKMDEEVQKWSRKDPLAIRKAMVFPENLEALERGELKFSCSYDETEPFGDSCGSAESEEGSDSEPEQEVDHQYSTTPQFINIASVKVEDSDYDHEVASMYDDEQEIEDDEDILRMEMALAEKELLQYEQRVTTSNAKRRKTTYYIQQ